MQMDIDLAGGCGTLSPQWYVKCDIEEESKMARGPLSGLKIVTSQGDVVSEPNQHIQGGADLDSIDLLIS